MLWAGHTVHADRGGIWLHAYAYRVTCPKLVLAKITITINKNVFNKVIILLTFRNQT